MNFLQILAIFSMLVVAKVHGRPQYHAPSSLEVIYAADPSQYGQNRGIYQGVAQQQQQYRPIGASASNGFSQTAAGGGGGGPIGGGNGGGSSVDCKMTEGADNRFRFTCEGVNPAAVTLKSEQILWLENPSGSPQQVDIEVPNYRIEDFIKAYFKQGGPGGNNRINVHLKRPEQSWEAQAQTPTSGTFTPQVSLQYEPVRQPQTIHYPRNTPYSSQPLPPLSERK